MGVADYVTKPFHVPELRTKLDRVLHSLEIDQENRVLREQLRSRPGFGGLIGVSPKMQRVYRLVEKVSQHKYPVLVLGEKLHRKGAGGPLDPLFGAAPQRAIRTCGLFRPESLRLSNPNSSAM